MFLFSRIYAKKKKAFSMGKIKIRKCHHAFKLKIMRLQKDGDERISFMDKSKVDLFCEMRGRKLADSTSPTIKLSANLQSC